MANTAVVGAGLAGPGTALVLARRGHRVVLVESDVAPVPTRADEIWDAWHGPGVAQAQRFHALPGRVRKVL